MNKLVIRTGNVGDFFARAKDAARRADQCDQAPRYHKTNLCTYLYGPDKLRSSHKNIINNDDLDPSPSGRGLG
ncbi:MAG: hypothetical protein ABSB19_00025 [Methylomonas sp.]